MRGKYEFTQYMKIRKMEGSEKRDQILKKILLNNVNLKSLGNIINIQ